MTELIKQILSNADKKGQGVTIFDGDNRLIAFNHHMRNIYKKADYTEHKSFGQLIVEALNVREVNLPEEYRTADEYIQSSIAFHSQMISGKFIRKLTDGRYFLMSHQRVVGKSLWYQTRQDITSEVMACRIVANGSQEDEWILRNGTSSAKVMEMILQSITGPAALIGEKGKIIGVNYRFYNLLLKENGIREVNERLLISDSVQNAVFRKAIDVIIAGGSESQKLLKISNTDSEFLYFMRLSPFSLPEEDLWRPKQRAVLLTVADPDRGRVVDPALLSELMGISLAEAEVVGCLVGGLSVQEISNKRNVTINTVSHQIKSVLNKTGLKSKMDVVRQAIYLSILVDS